MAQNTLAKVNQWLLPILTAAVISFGTYLVKTTTTLSERILTVEEWRQSTVKLLDEDKKLHDASVIKSHEALRVAIMRDVEQAASQQRENILAQLASIQRDVLRIAIMLDIQRPKDPVAWPPSKGDAKKNGDTVDDILHR